MTASSLRSIDASCNLRERDAVRVARRALRSRGLRDVRAESLSGYAGSGVVRLRRRGAELTIALDEIVVFAQWIANGAWGRDEALPTAEFTRPPWGRTYRWTGAAHRLAEAHERARAQR